jgi:hypothetical protein
MGDGFLEIVRAVDLSPKGVGIFLPHGIPESVINTRVELILTFPAERPVHVFGMVRRRDDRQHDCVVGVEFDEVPAKTEEALRRYLSQRSMRRSLAP